jgi:fatty-acyl-CoA synthase
LSIASGLCCGNGLRGDIWEPFKERFRIPQILEFYAATEANFSLYNCEGKPGAIGRIPSFLAHRFPVALVKFDVASGQARAQRGGLVRTLRHGRGGRGDQQDLREPRGRGGRFEGYSDEAHPSSRFCATSSSRAMLGSDPGI